MHRLARRSTAFALLALAAGLASELHAAPPPATAMSAAPAAAVSMMAPAATVTPPRTSPPASLPTPARLPARLPAFGDFAHAALIAFDTHIPAAQKTSALAALRNMAQNGNRAAQFAMGSLYMWGPRHPAALTPRDDAKAATYMSNAAIQGNTDAMAAMAEIELRTHHPVSALVWALADYYFREHGKHKPQSYTAGLILRTREGLTAAQRKQAVTDANRFIAQYGASILAPRPGFAPEPATCSIKETFRPWVYFADPADGMPHGGVGWYLYAVDARGRPLRHVAINEFPSWRLRRTFALNVRKMRFSPAPACPQPVRYALVPFHFNNRHYRFNH